jgi:hypothetical protein
MRCTVRQRTMRCGLAYDSRNESTTCTRTLSRACIAIVFAASSQNPDVLAFQVDGRALLDAPCITDIVTAAEVDR